MAEEWDVTLSRFVNGKGGGATMQVAIPAAIGRALRAKGYNRAKIRVTDEGILLVPYVSDEPATRGNRRVRMANIPDWEEP